MFGLVPNYSVIVIVLRETLFTPVGPLGTRYYTTYDC